MTRHYQLFVRENKRFSLSNEREDFYQNIKLGEVAFPQPGFRDLPWPGQLHTHDHCHRVSTNQSPVAVPVGCLSLELDRSLPVHTCTHSWFMNIPHLWLPMWRGNILRLIKLIMEHRPPATRTVPRTNHPRQMATEYQYQHQNLFPFNCLVCLIMSA